MESLFNTSLGGLDIRSVLRHTKLGNQGKRYPNQTKQLGQDQGRGIRYTIKRYRKVLKASNRGCEYSTNNLNDHDQSQRLDIFLVQQFKKWEPLLLPDRFFWIVDGFLRDQEIENPKKAISRQFDHSQRLASIQGVLRLLRCVLYGRDGRETLRSFPRDGLSPKVSDCHESWVRE